MATKYGDQLRLTVAFENNSDSRDLGHNLASDETGEWNIEWDWLYGSPDTGEYRIVKDILDFRSRGDYDQYKLAAEFTIF